MEHTLPASESEHLPACLLIAPNDAPDCVSVRTVPKVLSDDLHCPAAVDVEVNHGRAQLLMIGRVLLQNIAHGCGFCSQATASSSSGEQELER